MPHSMNTRWHKALDLDELPEGRVKTVTLGIESICVSHVDGRYGALDNQSRSLIEIMTDVELI